MSTTRRYASTAAALAGILVLALACSGGSDSTDVRPPTSTKHFRLVETLELKYSGEDRVRTETVIDFLGPDLWHVTTEEPTVFPPEFIIQGDRAWSLNGGFAARIEAAPLRATVLVFAKALEDLSSGKAESVSSGPQYAEEQTEVLVFVIDDYGKVYSDATSVGTEIMEGSSARLDVHVGVESRLVYYAETRTKGPNIDGVMRYEFDYDAPVSFQAPE